MVNNNSDDFGGLVRDQQVISRRRALGLLGAASFLAACGSKSTGSNSTSLVPSSSSPPVENSQPSAGVSIPSETQGPYPADGSNGPNVLSNNSIVRNDLTKSFGEYSGTAAGIPLTINLSVVDASSGEPLRDAAVYLWHCTADGQYSIYEVSNQNYLRGIQTTDSLGKLAFSTIFPGCYRGRWPHCHFEVFDSLDQANAGANARKVSQLALAEADCISVYKDSQYGNSALNLSQLSLQSDMVFADGWSDQLATVTGSIQQGLSAHLLVRI